MQIVEFFDMPYARAVVWQAFQNLDMMVDCLPGARLTSPAGQTPLELAFQIKIGPIVASFAGQGAIAYDPENFSGSFSGQGTDRKNNSRVKGEARFALLEATGPVTKVKVSVEFALTGTLAQFGRISIVKEIASGITVQFAANLKQQLVPTPLIRADGHTQDQREEGAESGLLVPSSTQGVSREVTVSLNLGTIVWQLLKRRFNRLFGQS